jgi:hypothetical protein
MRSPLKAANAMWDAKAQNAIGALLQLDIISARPSRRLAETTTHEPSFRGRRKAAEPGIHDATEESAE